MVGTPAHKASPGRGPARLRGGAAAGHAIVLALRRRPEDAAAAAARPRRESSRDPPATQGFRTVGRGRARGARANPDATLALISVAGDFAVAEARKAIRSGLNVMLFSDNVSIEEETQAETGGQGARAPRYGPDWGWAIIDGAPLAFANRISAGAHRHLGASGTHRRGAVPDRQLRQGVSQAIGWGTGI